MLGDDPYSASTLPSQMPQCQKTHKIKILHISTLLITSVLLCHLLCKTLEWIKKRERKKHKQTILHKKNTTSAVYPGIENRIDLFLHKSRVSKLNKSVLQIIYFLQDPFPLEACCACPPSVNSLQSVIRHRPTWLDFFLSQNGNFENHK